MQEKPKFSEEELLKSINDYIDVLELRRNMRQVESWSVFDTINLCQRKVVSAFRWLFNFINLTKTKKP
ncbi:hypothetical protein [Corallibacter vietnamensis]